jgi:hypothetical protein
MLDVFLIISNLIILIAVLYFVWDQRKKDRLQETETLSSFNETLSNVLTFIVDENKKLYETIEKIQVSYFESLEKHSQKSNTLLDKNNKEFLKVFAQVFKKDIKIETPKKIEADAVENSIENAAQNEEINLGDIPRIPIVDGVKIKFEDEEETQTMNIDPVENYEDKSINPIEK